MVKSKKPAKAELTFGEQVQAKRRALGMTQQDVAVRADISVGYVSVIERNLAKPGLEIAKRIYAALGVELVEEAASGR